MPANNWLTDYARVLQQLHAGHLASLEAVLAETVEFLDPFNHSQGRMATLCALAPAVRELACGSADAAR